MEQNDKDTLEAEKEQMNGQAEEAPRETASENHSDTNELEKSENNAEKNKEETSVSNGDEEENTNEEDEEEDELGDGFQPSVEMSIQLFEKDKGEIKRPIGRYNTVSYRKIKRGNTKQRIDEFESILDV